MTPDLLMKTGVTTQLKYSREEKPGQRTAGDRRQTGEGQESGRQERRYISSHAAFTHIVFYISHNVFAETTQE